MRALKILKENFCLKTVLHVSKYEKAGKDSSFAAFISLFLCVRLKLFFILFDSFALFLLTLSHSAVTLNYLYLI